jgi:hypothetical protein
MPALATSPSPTNLLLGKGKIYADRLSLSNGLWVKTGEFDLGNCTAFGISPKATVKEKYESMDSASSLYARNAINQNHTVKITGDEFSLFNLANGVMGDLITVSQTGASVTGETLTTAVKQGAYYATAYRSISAVTVKVGGTAKTLGTDYTIDAATGRIYIVPGGGITGGATVTCDYTYATITLNGVSSSTHSSIKMFLRYVGAPVSGPTFEVQVYVCDFAPSGDIGLISDDYGNWTLEGMALAGTNLSPDGSPYRVLQLA